MKFIKYKQVARITLYGFDDLYSNNNSSVFTEPLNSDSVPSLEVIISLAVKSVASSERVKVIVACSPAVSDALLVVREIVGGVVSFATWVNEVSAIDTDAVDPTCVERDESEKSFMFRVSDPSVARSFARVWEKEKDPFDETIPEPVSAPEEKSDVLIPEPLSA